MRETRKAFLWILAILRKYKIPFQVSGGLAARIYGSQRELADIDIDIPEKAFQKILRDVSKYLIFGPRRYKDRNWDLRLVILRYRSQEIDLCGAEESKIFNKKMKKWVSNRVDFSKNVRKKMFGAIVPVISKRELLSAKIKLARRVDLEDVKQIMSKKYRNSPNNS